MEGDWPRTGGEMARKVRSFDWSATALGPISSWPAELKSAAALVLESGFPAALVWGPELVTVYNDGFRPILGDKPEALGRSFAEIWAEVWVEIGPIVARAFDGESTFIENFPLVVNRSGRPEQAFFTFSYSPVRAADGSVVGMIDTVVETTQQVRVEQALRDSEERLRRSLESMTDAVYIGTAEGIAVANQAAFDQLGFDSIDQLNRNIRLIIEEMETRVWPTGEVLRPDQHAFVRALRGEEVVLEVSVRHRHTGEQRILRSAASPLILNGEIAGAIAVNADITERMRAEERLRASEARLKAATDLVGLSSYTWDPAARALEWDARLKAMWGLPADAHIDYDRWLSAIHPDDRPQVEAAVAACTDPDGDGVYRVEYRVIGIEDRVERWVSTYGRTSFADGRPVSLIGAVIDITERKRAEQALHILVAELQHRTRNLLALVRTIARRTLRTTASLDDFSQEYEDRLASLSRVQGLLSRDIGYSASLHEVIAGELEPYADGSGRVRIAGPAVRLPARAVQTLTLALHELTTNAVKHGGLAQEAARLSVTWEAEAGNPPVLTLRWAESGVRIGSGGSKSREGFGSYLIERVLPAELDAETSYELTADGARCEIRLPLDEGNQA